MTVVLLSALVVVAAMVGTITGFGTSTVMVPVMVMFFPIEVTLLCVGIIHWFGNVWKLLLFRGGLRRKLILSFGIPGIIASFIGARLMRDIPSDILPRILGVFMIVYVLFLLIKSAFRVPDTTRAAAIGGAVSGFFAGIFGVGGAVRSMFLAAFNLPKAVYLTTGAAIALFIDTTRLVTYVGDGARLEPVLLWGLLLFIPASFLGARLGKRVVDRIPQRHFRTVVAIVLLALGIKLLFFSK